MLLSDVDAVMTDFGTPRARRIHKISTAEARNLELASGSMDTKVEAACRFAEATGHVAGIGALDQAADVLSGRRGHARLRRRRGHPLLGPGPGQPTMSDAVVPPRGIAVGVDGSELAMAALAWTLRMASALNAEVVAVHGQGLLESGGVVPSVDLDRLVAEVGPARTRRPTFPRR